MTTKKPVELDEESVDHVSGGPGISPIPILGHAVTRAGKGDVMKSEPVYAAKTEDETG